MLHRNTREFVLVVLAALAFVGGWSLANGRDINWDFINYHLYAGFAADGSRINHDYFPASVQSYLLGYVYWPMALAVLAGWPDWAVQLLLGVQSVPAVLAVWLIAVRLTAGADHDRPVWRLLMLAIACSAPVFLSELGTSFADGSTGGLVLLAIWLLLPDSQGRLRPWAPWVAGLLAGIACGLKMTNIPMTAPIALALLFASPGSMRARAKLALRFSLGCAVGFLLLYAHWGALLHQRFGNPFFPVFLNGFFGAPEYFHASISLERFKPQTVMDFLLRPVYMLDPVSNLYTEARSPDARYAALMILAVFWALSRRRDEPASDPALTMTLTWVAGAWVIWLLTSGNGRYAIVLAMMAGLVAVALAQRIWHARRFDGAILKSVCVGLLAAQVLGVILSTTFRWDPRIAMHGRYFAPEIDERLRSRPVTVVNLTTQSASWMVPYLHPESVMTSPTGQYMIAPRSPAGDRLLALLRSGRPIVVAFDPPDSDADPVSSARLIQPSADLYGLVIDPDACYGVVIDRYTIFGSDDQQARKSQKLVCDARHDPALMQRTIEEYRRADALFDRLEDACPHLYTPARPQTICTANVCFRAYINTDITVQVNRDGGVTMHGFGTAQPTLIGRTTDRNELQWAATCPPRPRAYLPFSAGAAVMAMPR